MRNFALIFLAVTAAVAAYVTGYDPEDPFLEGMEFGADADAVEEAMSGAGYGLQESSAELIIGVRGNERLEYRFDAAGGQSFAEYSLAETSSVKIAEEFGAWSKRISDVWGTPSAMSAEGSQLWIIPHMYSIRLSASDSGIVVSVNWD